MIFFLNIADVDFGSFTQEFTLTRNAPEQCFNVTIVDDSILEIQEYFRASITAVGELPQNATLNITEARVNIIDNESELTLGSVEFDIFTSPSLLYFTPSLLISLPTSFSFPLFSFILSLLHQLLELGSCQRVSL